MEMRKSEQIRADLQKSFQIGTSAKASTVCYGYKVTHTGELVIDPIEDNSVAFKQALVRWELKPPIELDSLPVHPNAVQRDAAPLRSANIFTGVAAPACCAAEI